ncbi:hypothetical protein FRB94_012775 [Tulasnella sp. JGI-2019a]|nr:hypothetical protein FRB94_012775 [Tulasnella sp. JGI-2019a]
MNHITLNPLVWYYRKLQALDSFVVEQSKMSPCTAQETFIALRLLMPMMNHRLDGLNEELSTAHESLMKFLNHPLPDGEAPFDLWEDGIKACGGFAEVHIGWWRPMNAVQATRVAVKHLRARNIDTEVTNETDVQERLRKLIQAADGFNFLHSRQPPIVHQDIKPDNILINSSKEAVISDFGLAKIKSEIPAGFTTEGATKGTLLYMAPELHMDTAAEGTLETDVYAFALLILEILLNKRPYWNEKMHLLLALSEGFGRCLKITPN